ncbi:hypothetical protein MSG28_015460 [Choristoneura fumiferana]|uniref:Uncharacterized protein n=1 Tax=Choristoneura fumiferana TaxID=7141 RepID=A0ACC0KA86_CHOFU|nr:hypothetical protein MSG28_015460 [Choristoneura fumiferana]
MSTMARKFLGLCVAICLLDISLCQQNKDGIVFNYNNTYKYDVEYTVNVSKNVEYIMEFDGDSYDTPARVTVASNFANSTFPLFVTARQQKGVSSWQLPMLVQTPSSLEQFTNISRTLCPHNNMFSEDEDTCDVTNQNTPLVHLTSSSPDPIEVTIVVETVKDFYIKLNTTTNMTVTPSQPKYYFFPFKQEKKMDLKAQSARRQSICNDGVSSYFLDNDLFKKDTWFSQPKSVIVMIESDDDICAVISIQNFSCPVFDNERNILYDGYYLSMTRRGGITLNQDTFPMGFYIVFIVKTSDEYCTGDTANKTLPTMARYLGWEEERKIDLAVGDGRVKNFTLRIIATISYQEYMIAAGAVLAFFLCFYVAFIIAVVVQRRQARLDAEANLNEGELLLDSAALRRQARLDAEANLNEGELLTGFCCPGTLDANELQLCRAISQRRKREQFTFTECLASPATPHDEVSVARRRVRTINIEAESSSQQCLVGDGPRRDECSSSSDTESDYSTLDDINREKDLRMGGRLCVANLAKCRPRVLQARSKMYLWNVLTVAVFYTLPVIQLVVTYQRLLNQSGNQDLCYFNALCAHPLFALSDFNHVYSNLGYVVLGALFLAAVWRRHDWHQARSRREISTTCTPIWATGLLSVEDTTGTRPGSMTAVKLRFLTHGIIPEVPGSQLFEKVTPIQT